MAGFDWNPETNEFDLIREIKAIKIFKEEPVMVYSELAHRALHQCIKRTHTLSFNKATGKFRFYTEFELDNSETVYAMYSRCDAYASLDNSYGLYTDPYEEDDRRV
jgi:hypothetical protein